VATAAGDDADNPRGIGATGRLLLFDGKVGYGASTGLVVWAMDGDMHTRWDDGTTTKQLNL
jgi:hypothetical protein